MEEVVMRSFDAGILTVTLNRPEQLNAMTWPMMGQLLAALRDAAADPAVRVVVLTGAGRGFCSGGDIRTGEQVDELDPAAVKWSGDPLWKTTEQRVSQVLRYVENSVLLHTMAKPTIAMVRGPCAGAGLCLAAACDFRILSETAVFTTVFANVARSGDYGGSYLLHHLVGPAKARELYLLADKFDAKEADRLGLATKLVPDADLETATMALAQRLAKGPAIAYRYIKRNLNAAETGSFRDVLEMEAMNMMRCSATEDARESGRAFKERRPPVFKGM